nr:hypothetical protein CFP56_47802 [Quercus suber]
MASVMCLPHLQCQFKPAESVVLKDDGRGGGSVQGAADDSPIQVGQCATGESESREMSFFPPSGTPHDLRELKGLEDALSLVGQQAQSVKEHMEVSSPVKFKAGLNEEKRNTPEPIEKETVRKTKAEANWKRIAREKGKNKSPSSSI